MPKQVTMWENVDGDLFETELEANEAEAKSALEKLGVTEVEIEAYEKLLTTPELWTACTKWMNLKHQVSCIEKAMEEVEKKERQANCKHQMIAYDNIKSCRLCFIKESELNGNHSS